jgi:phosphoglycerate dehydrogenase-like enzyme
VSDTGAGPEVLFCSASFPRARALLRERLAGGPIRLVDVDPRLPVAAQVGTVEALIPSMAHIDAEVIGAAPRLRLIVQYGSGLEGVDRAAAEARGIPVRNVPGVNAEAVAEHALFLMLALARRLPRHADSFSRRIVGDPVGMELRGKTLGIVGLGSSGRALARLGRAMGMSVIATRRRAQPGDTDPDVDELGGPGQIDALLARADFVSLHVPSGPETRGLLDAARLARMRPTAFIVNVGRGDLIDRVALEEALVRGRIAGAGLDVYWREPPDPDDPLLRMPNVVATPHVAGLTHESLARVADRVAAILREHLLGDPA